MDHVLARLQEIHDLVRRNTHQAELRQKLKYNRAKQAKAYKPGDLVWVFCRYVPQKSSPKLMRSWRGPHRIFHTLQDGRVYILDTGQKVHFERLKPHNSGPLEFAVTPLDAGDIAVVMDPEPERSMEPIDDDCSKPSYHSEQLLSEASAVSLHSRQRHWMDTRLRTKLRAGGTRQHYQQFDYSTSETDDETLPKPPTAPSIERGRGRPRKKTRATRAPRSRKPSAKAASKVHSPISDTQTGSQHRYQLWHKRQPRYKCGTCGLHDCVCVLAVHENRVVPIRARGVPPEGRHKAELVHRIVVRAEKTFAGLERTENYSAETILQRIGVPGDAKAPCPQFNGIEK